MIATVPTPCVAPVRSIPVPAKPKLQVPVSVAVPSDERAHYARAAFYKLNFIRLARQFQSPDYEEQVRTGLEWNQLEHAWERSVSVDLAWGWLATLNCLLKQAKDRQTKGHSQFFHPFCASESEFVRAYYADKYSVFHFATDCRLTTKLGYPLTNGYTRLVVGDYGAYIEFEDAHLVAKLATKFPGKQATWVKYIWMVHPGEVHWIEERRRKDPPCLLEPTKIYLQQHTVKYADYVPGKYYVSPDEVQTL
jgi:hypothetical protein